MNCIYCKNKTKVVDTVTDGKVTIRKRKCIKCNGMFFTREEVSDYDECSQLLYKLKESRRSK